MGSQNKPLQTDAAEPALATAAPSGGEFVNTGLLTWLERRRQWIRRTAQNQDQRRTPRKRTYSPAVTPEQVLSDEPFPKPVPLEDVIEVLTEIWERGDCYT